MILNQMKSLLQQEDAVYFALIRLPIFSGRSAKSRFPIGREPAFFHKDKPLYPESQTIVTVNVKSTQVPPCTASMMYSWDWGSVPVQVICEAEEATSVWPPLNPLMARYTELVEEVSVAVMV